MSQDLLFVNNYLPALLAQASVIISTEFHQVVQKHGRTITEWRVLSILFDAGIMSMGELGKIATSKQPTVTRVVDKLVNDGHINRIPHDTDRRITLVEITKSGQALVSGLITEAKKHEEELIQRLYPLDVESLKVSLRHLISESS